MNNQEENIQRAIESGSEPDGDRLEINAYREVFGRLSRLPEIRPAADIENIVLTRILRRRQQQSRLDYIWLAVGILLLLIVCVIAVAFTGVGISASFLTRVPDVTGVVIFGILFVVVLNRLDKKLLLRRADRLTL